MSKENSRFRFVNAQAREKGKPINDVNRKNDLHRVLSRDREVVCKRIKASLNVLLQGVEKNIITNCKEERREGAALLDPSANGDPFPIGHFRREDWKNPHFVKEPFDDVDGPGGEANFAKDRKNKIVINTIKGFFCV